MLKTRLASTGAYVPPHVVKNSDLEKIMDTSDEWIQKRSGIQERRWVKDETTLSMAVAASQQALDKAGLKADDIDAIIFGALVTDYVFPGTGVLLQRELGFKATVPALDIRNQCSGFLYGMSVADAWIRTGMYKRILLVGSEIHSTTLDKSTAGRDISVLFGDGAGAAILEATESEGSQIIDTVLHSEGAFAERLAITKPSANDHPRIPEEGWQDREHFPYMEGKLVFKNAVSRMTECMQEVLQKNGMQVSDVDFVIAHQANLRINNMVLETLGIPFEKSHNTLQKYGNTTMATIPLTFDEAIELGKIKRGDLVAFVAFGAGFTWGASLLRY